MEEKVIPTIMLGCSSLRKTSVLSKECCKNGCSKVVNAKTK